MVVGGLIGAFTLNRPSDDHRYAPLRLPVHFRTVRVNFLLVSQARRSVQLPNRPGRNPPRAFSPSLFFCCGPANTASTNCSVI